MKEIKEKKNKKNRAELLKRAREYFTEEALKALQKYEVPLEEIIAMGERGFEALRKAKKETFQIPVIEIKEEMCFNEIKATLPNGKEFGCELDGVRPFDGERRRWIPVWLFKDLNNVKPGSREYTAALMSLFLP